MKQLICALLLLSTGHALAVKKIKRYLPLTTGEVKIVGDYDMEQIDETIVRALTRRGWKIVENHHDGEILSRINVRKHQADIKVEYDTKEIKIIYLDSVNLGYRMKGDRAYIRRGYNGWIWNLERDISTYLRYL